MTSWRTSLGKLVALARLGQQARSEGRATGSVEGTHELLRLACVRAKVVARAQAASSRSACLEAASHRYRHPAQSGYSTRRGPWPEQAGCCRWESASERQQSAQSGSPPSPGDRPAADAEFCRPNDRCRQDRSLDRSRAELPQRLQNLTFVGNRAWDGRGLPARLSAAGSS